MGMPGNIRAVDHDERLSTVDHLEELRSRLILALVAVAVAFTVCFWQNHRLLRLVDAPLAHQTRQQVRDGNGPLGATYRIQQSTRDLAVQLRTVVATLNGPPQTLVQRRTFTQVSRNLAQDARRLSAPPDGDRPVTLGIGEPFTTTVTVSFVFALVLSAARDAITHGRDPAAVPRRCYVRLLRCTSGGGALLSELQQHAVQRSRPGRPLLLVRRHDAPRDGSPIRDARGDLRHHARRPTNSTTATP
jgi:hypothetical protein